VDQKKKSTNLLENGQPENHGNGAAKARLRLLHTTDSHMAILPYDYWSDHASDTMGLSRTATLIRQAQAEALAANTACLLLEGGDFLQGNPLGDYLVQIYETARQTQPHPMMAVLNALGYDAATLGNHEFNFGLEYLEKVLKQAEFPVVCANVLSAKGDSPAGDKTLLPPWTVIERPLHTGNAQAGSTQTIRIGVLGVTPPQVAIWDRRHLRGRVRTRDMVEAARAQLPALRAAGADIVIALNHSGIHGRLTAGMAENAGLDLAALDGIDVVLCGHQHALFPGPGLYADGPDGIDAKAGTLHGKPALMSGCLGAHLGVLDLDLTQDDDGRWQVAGHRAELRPTYRRDTGNTPVPLVEEDTEVRALAARSHASTLTYVRQPVGHCAQPLHSYFSLMDNERSVQLVASAQLWRVRELLEEGPLSRLPLLSAAAPFKTGGHSGPEHYTEIPAGPLSIRDLYALYQFPNDLRVVQVTGANLRDWLERSAGQFRQIRPGTTDQPLRDQAFPSYNFDVIMGLEYSIDLSQPSRFDLNGDPAKASHDRITDMRYKGEPVRDDQLFLVATNSYRAGGGGTFAGASGDSVVLSVPESSFEVLRKYVTAHAEIDLPLQDIWQFAPMPGTSVTFDTHPRALAFLDEVQGRKVEQLGQGAPGYTRLRLHL